MGEAKIVLWGSYKLHRKGNVRSLHKMFPSISFEAHHQFLLVHIKKSDWAYLVEMKTDLEIEDIQLSTWEVQWMAPEHSRDPGGRARSRGICTLLCHVDVTPAVAPALDCTWTSDSRATQLPVFLSPSLSKRADEPWHSHHPGCHTDADDRTTARPDNTDGAL